MSATDEPSGAKVVIETSEIVRCGECSLAAVIVPCGFIAEPTIRCTERNLSEVGRDDGCTMGAPGEPQPMIDRYDIDLSVAYNPTNWEIDSGWCGHDSDRRTAAFA